MDRGSAAEGPISALAAAPGGRTIAVQRGGATILMVSVGGVRLGSFTPVSDSVAAFDWAPDGQRLAVRTGGGGTPSAIAIVGLDGRTEVSLPLPDGFGYQTSGGDTGPLWSPDGRWLAVVGCQACDTKVEAHILLVAAEGSGYHWMSDNSAVVDYSMAWSTNSLIAIGRWGAKPVSVAILSTDGSLVRDATLPDSLGPELLAWSPDGTTLAVMGWPVSFSPPAQLVVIPPDRDATVIPTNLQGVSGIRWLSDGTRILACGSDCRRWSGLALGCRMDRWRANASDRRHWPVRHAEAAAMSIGPYARSSARHQGTADRTAERPATVDRLTGQPLEPRRGRNGDEAEDVA